MKRAVCRLRAAAAAAVALSLAGCAVMTIDVDVYKGPLANDDKIQAQQFGLLAVSVKPLLIQLRDGLEWGDPASVEKALKSSEVAAWYKPRFVDPSGTFAKRPARVVNNLMYLFENERQTPFAGFAAETGAAVMSLEAAAAVLSPDPDSDGALWSTFIPAGAAIAPEFNDSDARRLRSCLMTLYEGLIAPSRRNSNRREAKAQGTWIPQECVDLGNGDPVSIPHVAADLFKKIDGALRQRLRLTADVEEKAPKVRGRDLRSDDVFAVLADKAVVSNHARLLFGPDAKINADFIERVTEIARAYNGVRNSVQQIWEAAVDVLPKVSQDPASLKRVAALIAGTTEVERLLVVAYGSPGFEALKARLDPHVVKESDGSLSPGHGRPYFEAIRAALRDAIEQAPEPTVSLLESAHRMLRVTEDSYKRAFVKNPVAKLASKYSSAESRANGIARDVSLIRDSRKDWEFIRQAYRELIDAGGVEAGRPEDGLEPLTASLEKAMSIGAPADEIRKLETRLHRALIHFAQKLVTIADHQVLLENDGRAPGIDKFVVGLQAFGNAILANADHVFRRQAHETKDAASGPAELAAWAQALGRTHGDIVDDLIGLLAQAEEAAKAELDKTKKTAAAEKEKLAYVVEAYDQRGTRERGVVPAGDPDPAFKRKVDAGAIVLDADEALKVYKEAISSTLGTTPLTKAQAKAKVVEWLAARIGTFGKASEAAPERLLLVNLQRYLAGAESPTFDGDAAKADTKTQFAAILEAIDSHERSNAVKALDAIKAAQEKKLEKGQEEETGATDALKLRQAETALLAKKKPAILARARAAKRSEADPTAVLDAIDAVMRDIKDEAEESAKAVRALVAEQRPRLALLRVPQRLEDGGASPTKRSDVLDQFIALMKYGETVATAAGNRKRAGDYRAAVTKAEAQKAEVTFIRPASAYLRTSFAATGLQDNTGFAWQNRLARHAWRGFPLIGEAAANFGDEDRLEILAQVDKQFWQNINRVKVAGAGNTNYAIIKDDIGNWSVKSYSADPKDIIASAKGLALFNIGAAMGGIDLIAREARRETPGGAEDEASPDAGRTAMAQVFDRHRKAYETEATDDFDAVVALLSESGLKASIATAWAGDPETKAHSTTLGQKLDAAFAGFAAERTAFGSKNDASGKKLTAQQLAAKIPAGLRLAIRFYKAAVGTLPGSLTAGLEAGEARNMAVRAEEVARKLAARLTRDGLDIQLARRLERVAAYRRAVHFIGEASSPAADPPKGASAPITQTARRPG